MTDTLQPPSGSTADAVAPGQRLADARQAQNLSAADIARQLKLSVWQVEALEKGNYQQLPGPIFVRGFIRNYARLVKIDPNELLRAAGDSLPQAAARPETPPSREIPFPTEQSPRWPKYVAAAAVIFGVLAVYEFVWNEPEGATPGAVAVTPVPMAQEPKAEAERPSPQPVKEAVAAQPAAATVVAAAPVPEATPPTPAVEPTAQTPRDIPTRKRGEKSVRLDFDQESWVEIRDRNERVIFSQLNRPGTMQEVNGLPPLSVVVGNAHGVRMTFAEQPVDLARHTKVDVARLILE